MLGCVGRRMGLETGGLRHIRSRRGRSWVCRILFCFVGGGCGRSLFGDDFFEKNLGFVVELFGDFCAFFVPGFEGFGFGVPDATEFPGVEEGCPVDVVGEFAEGLRFDAAGAGEFGDRWGVVFPVDLGFVGLGFGEGDGGFFGTAGVFFAGFLVIGFVLGDEGVAVF